MSPLPAYPAGMDLSNPVFSGLIRKRQELASDLDAAQAALRRVVASLNATMPAVPPRPRP